MIIEYNKFNIILYFLTGVASTFVMRRWVYGIMIISLSAFILFQRLVIQSDNAGILKYQDYTKIPALFVTVLLIVTSLYILSKFSKFRT